MSNEHIAVAKSTLNKLLESQPNLFTPLNNTSEDGEKVAEFCAAFIRKYSALIAEIEKGAQSR